MKIEIYFSAAAQMTSSDWPIGYRKLLSPCMQAGDYIHCQELAAWQIKQALCSGNIAKSETSAEAYLPASV